MTESRPLQHRQRRAVRDSRVSGLTLIEISLIVGMLGLSAIYATEHYISDLKLQRQDSQVVGAINDALGILEASRVYWYSGTTAIAKWPHTSTTTGGTTTYTVAIGQLWDTNNQFLAEEPPTRFPVECSGAACTGYALIGWDTSISTTSAGTVDDELQLSFQVPDERRAKAVAAQLPSGIYECSTGATCADTDPHTVTARIDHEKYSFSPGVCSPPPSGSFMRLCGEDRDVEFNSGVGQMYKIRRITRRSQELASGLSATCEANFRLKGAGVAMDTDELSIAACGDSPTSPSAVLRMETDGTEPSMEGTFRDGSGNMHVLTYGMEDPTGGTGVSNVARVPYIEFAAYQGVGASPAIEALFKLQARNSFSGTTSSWTYPAGWDIHLMDAGSSNCHRPVQQRLCRFRQPILQGKAQYGTAALVKYDALCSEDGDTPAALIPSGC